MTKTSTRIFIYSWLTRFDHLFTRGTYHFRCRSRITIIDWFNLSFRPYTSVSEIITNVPVWAKYLSIFYIKYLPQEKILWLLLTSLSLYCNADIISELIGMIINTTSFEIEILANEAFWIRQWLSVGSSCHKTWCEEKRILKESWFLKRVISLQVICKPLQDARLI